MILFAEDASLGSPIQLVFAVDPTINIFCVRWFFFLMLVMVFVQIRLVEYSRCLTRA